MEAFALSALELRNGTRIAALREQRLSWRTGLEYGGQRDAARQRR